MRYAIPAAILVVLLVFLGFGLRRDPTQIASPLVGKPMPAFALEDLDTGVRVAPGDFAGRAVLVNFWASWCAGCQIEHPLLLRLARENNVEIIGFDYKDAPEDAKRWLAQRGNPYRQVLRDDAGTAGLDFGVYGVPETFVIGPDGTILHKHIGAVTEQAWRDEIAPKLGVSP